MLTRHCLVSHYEASATAVESFETEIYPSLRWCSARPWVIYQPTNTRWMGKSPATSGSQGLWRWEYSLSGKRASAFREFSIWWSLRIDVFSTVVEEKGRRSFHARIWSPMTSLNQYETLFYSAWSLPYAKASSLRILHKIPWYFKTIESRPPAVRHNSIFPPNAVAL